MTAVKAKGDEAADQYTSFGGKSFSGVIISPLASKSRRISSWRSSTRTLRMTFSQLYRKPWMKPPALTL